ncbi:MAG: phospholipase D family protein [Polymorphobacter sp.]
MGAVGTAAVMEALVVLAVLVLLHRLACWRYRLPPARHADDAPPLPPLLRPEDRRPGMTGIYPLDDARQAFAARMLLVRRARICLDVQYYIWHRDTSGLLLLNELRRAADRGVRVRLLLDDNGIAGLDPVLAALAVHPHISVRLFNPFVIRRPKAIGYLVDFRRLNRRMHNKSLTADGRFTILGGRNIGDAYMGASEQALFADLDVFATGAVVADVTSDFERYWQSESAWPATQLLPPDRDGLARFDAEVAALKLTPLARDYGEAVREGVARRLVAGDLALEWAPTVLISDDPAKGLGDVAENRLVSPRLVAAMGQPHAELSLVSAYFVPTAAGIAAFAAIAATGAEVQVMTNVLKTNDVAMVHAGYAPSRKPLLRAGIRLWEMKGADPAKPARLRFRRRRREQRAGTIFRSSGSALHAKTFAVDRQRIFVGSFNFDPRSVRLNTEMGLMIDSQELAGRLQEMFDTDIAGVAYEVRLRGRRLVWAEANEMGEVIHTCEPGTSLLQRAVMAVLSHLPVKWLL